MELPIFKVVLNEEADGVDFVSLVDNPAIEENWMVFNSQKIEFQSTEKGVVSGPLLIADKLIYRNDERGEYNIVFTKDIIEKIVYKFFKGKNTSNVNMMHSEKALANGVYMFESFIIDSKRGINTPDGFEELADGSWFGSFKVDNQKIWDDFVKTGRFKGFSVEGFFGMDRVENKEQKLINQIKELLKQV